MADNQDKLTPSDQKILAELEQQLGKDKAAPAAAAKEHPKAAGKKAEPTLSSSTASSKKPADPKSSTHSKRSATSQPKSKTLVLWIFTIVNLLLLVAIIGAGYWTWLQWQTQNQQQTEDLAEQTSSIKQQQTEISRSIASNELGKEQLEGQNQALQLSIKSMVEQLQLTSEQVQNNQRNLADVSGRRPADWLLAEADYLVRMAGRKLWLERDVKTAIMMLQSADSRIQDLDDPSLLPVRERLASDIYNLQQVNQVSTSSIALALGAMLKQVDNLPLAFFTKPEQEAAEDTVSESISDWRTNLARNWQEVTKNFFSVKRVTTEIKPFMSEQQQWLSHQQLKFSLLQAQVAAMQENPTLYQQSLQNAFTLIIEFFDTEQLAVVQFTDSLSQLQQTDFTRTYPDKFDVAPLLHDVIENRLDSRFINGKP